MIPRQSRAGFCFTSEIKGCYDFHSAFNFSPSLSSSHSKTHSPSRAIHYEGYIWEYCVSSRGGLNKHHHHLHPSIQCSRSLVLFLVLWLLRCVVVVMVNERHATIYKFNATRTTMKVLPLRVAVPFFKGHPPPSLSLCECAEGGRN